VDRIINWKNKTLSLDNWQIKDITPEAWAKTSRFSATATAA